MSGTEVPPQRVGCNPSSAITTSFHWTGIPIAKPWNVVVHRLALFYKILVLFEEIRVNVVLTFKVLSKETILIAP